MQFNKLRFTINTSVLLAVLLLSAIFGAILYVNELRRNNNAINNVYVLCSSIYDQKRDDLANELFAEKREALNITLSEMSRVEGFYAISVYSNDGLLFLSTMEAAKDQLQLEERESLNQRQSFRRIAFLGSPMAVFSTKIEVIGERVGYLKLYYDLSSIKSETVTNLIIFLVLLCTLSMITIGLLNWLLSRLVVQPVSHLSQAMNEVREGNLGRTVELKSNSEIGEMAESFNLMSKRLKENRSQILEAIDAREAAAQRLASSNRELESLNLELEARVRARTSELEASNRELTLRLGELSRRNNEIESLNRMGEMLQACGTLKVAYQVISTSSRELFPNSCGFLAVPKDNNGKFCIVASWGDEVCDLEINFNDCLALRRGKILAAPPESSDTLCPLACAKKKVGFLCAPMLAYEDVVGLLHIHPRERCGDGNNWSGLESQKRLLLAMSEHAALALANIQLREDLRLQSIRDPLTGLFNRRFMEESLDREAGRAIRRNASLGIIMIDLDYFKQFNDVYGHEAGDIMLVGFSDLLVRNIRTEDIACRFGGEEFTIILPEADIHHTARKAEELRRKTSELEVIVQGNVLTGITLSAGVAAFPHNGDNPRHVLRMADKALYQAKTTGRNSVRVFDSET